MASELKVSRATIERDAKFALAVDALIETLGEETRRYILSRDAKLTKRDTLELAEVARREPIARLLDEVEQLRERMAETSRSDIT